MSTEPSFRRIAYPELSLGDIAALQECLKVDYNGRTVEWIMEEISTGLMQLWDVGSGVKVLTKLYDFPRGRELYIVTVIGKFVKSREWLAGIKLVAKEVGANWAQGEVANKVFGRVWKWAGAKEVATVWRLEL